MNRHHVWLLVSLAVAVIIVLLLAFVIPQQSEALAGQATSDDTLDSDNDGVADLLDNCPFVANPEQIDEDANGIGDLCDWEVLSSGTSHHLWDGWITSSGGLYLIGESEPLSFGLVTQIGFNFGGDVGLYDLFAFSDDSLYAVGTNGKVAYFDGSWTLQPTPTNQILYGVWGNSVDSMYAVGQAGTILHYDGVGWSSMAVPTTENLYAIWGNSEDNIYAVGDKKVILHYDGVEWVVEQLTTSSTLYAIWGSSSDDIYTVGTSGTILHYDGSGWSELESNIVGGFRDVYGFSAEEVYFVSNFGENSQITLYDSTDFIPVFRSTSTQLLGLIGAPSSRELYALGRQGTLLYSPLSNFVSSGDLDPCIASISLGELDTDNDGVIDRCDRDDDNDRIPDQFDNCPLIVNSAQRDADGDGVGNVCDNCRDISNIKQLDTNGDGVGDVCELVTSLLGDFNGDGCVSDEEIARAIDLAYAGGLTDEEIAQAIDNALLGVGCSY